MEKKSTKSGYRPSDSVKKRIAAWEGSAMTGAIDPLSGKWGKNRTFEEEASSFYHALPADIREQVISNPGLADNLFSYSYNVGAGRFKERVVPALRKYYAGKGSAEEIASSMWASGDKKLRGLRNRRAVERQGVVDSLAPSPVQPIFDVPADNTFVFNPFPIHAESTTVAPIMVPDTYVEAHRLTPSEDRVNRFQEAMEARRQYNNLMDAISIQNNPAPQYTPQTNPVNAPYVVASYDKGGYLRKSWNDLSMSEKAEMMKVAVRNGITNLQDIRDKYNEFAEGGGISDEEYYSTMEKVAEDNYQKWGLSSPDEALVHALNDNTYNYRGYYDAYPQSTADASTHWPDEFKTVYHPTFSDESKYSGQRSQYNPLGLTGGYWVGDTFIPRAWQMLDSNKHSIGGPLVEAAMNEYRSGGKIHIKPSHRGRLTDLKKRTGKTEAELYRTGSPATRKMITFARNARKWKHGLGGNLYPGGGFIGLMPAMPGIAIDSNAAENIATTASKKVMNYIKGAHDTGSYFSYDPSMEAYAGPAQDTYLLPRKLQEKEFLRRGYIKGKDKDYGLVKRAVGDRDLPVYQRNPDAITRDNLTVIGNIHGWDPWYGSADTALEHPGSYPTAVYTDAEGNFFQKGWDLNDYGGKTGSTIGFLSDIVDRIGSPTVVTTGYQPVSNPQDKSFIQAITPMMAKKGLVPTEINGKTEWALPEVTITGKKRKKSFGGNLFYPGGEITYGRPYYSYDTNGRRINDTLNYNASIPDIVITPDSKKSPAERAILERERRRAHDAYFGKGTYNAKLDREQTELAIAASDNAWKKSLEGQVLNIGKNVASGVKTAAEFIPVTGDIIQGLDVAKDTVSGNYLSAGLGLGMLAVPNLIEKPLKYLGKGIKSIFELTDSQWDEMYNAAIKAGDIEEAQKLRDLHFMAKAPDTAIANEGLPIHAYHGTGKQFNEFDTTGKYSTLDEGYYGVGAYFAPNKEIADMYAGTERTPIVYDTYLNIKNPLRHVRDENADLYGKPIVNNDGVIAVLPDDLVDPDFDMTEFVATKPNQIKKADTVTYDDAGNIIPLSQRDNFSLGDMRYGLLPFGIGLTGYGLFNNQEALGGNLFELGGPEGGRGRMPRAFPRNREKDPEAYDAGQKWIQEEQERKVQREKRDTEYAEEKAKRNARAAEEFNRDKDIVMSALSDTADSILFTGNQVVEAAEEQRQEKVDKVHELKSGLDATMTAAEFLAAGYGVARGLTHLNRYLARKATQSTGQAISRDAMRNLVKWNKRVNQIDKPQVLMNGIGGTADAYQWYTADNSLDAWENGLETGANAAGVVGGMNWFRDLPYLRRIGGDKIDNVLDGLGYGAAAWDVVKNIPPLSTALEKVREQSRAYGGNMIINSQKT